ncbi:MAG: serine acetyltransferase [Streptococcaceae bacterium]|nr:serine acetyltransferase [Streptococcaceae bacterium]
MNQTLNSQIPFSCQIGAGTIIDHPYGIILHPATIIGNSCILRQQVTIGNKGTPNSGAPIIGNHVNIGAGAKLIGPISVGDNTMIGANAVVTKSFEAGAVLVGVPAKNIHKKSEQINV